MHKFIAKNLNSWVEDYVRPFAVYRVSVTEIPEHLLQRSRRRRCAQGSDASPSAPAETTSSSSAPVPAEAAHHLAQHPEQLHQKLLRSSSEARFLRRLKISLTKEGSGLGDGRARPSSDLDVYVCPFGDAQAEEASGPLAIGAEQYATCAGCHGGNGQGGVGYQFSEGEVERRSRISKTNSATSCMEPCVQHRWCRELRQPVARWSAPPLVTGRLPGFAGAITDYELLGRFVMSVIRSAVQTETATTPKSSKSGVLKIQKSSLSCRPVLLLHHPRTTEGIIEIGDGPADGSPPMMMEVKRQRRPLRPRRPRHRRRTRWCICCTSCLEGHQLSSSNNVTLPDISAFLAGERQANRCLLKRWWVLKGHAVDSIRFTYQTRLTERPLRSGSAIVIRQDELFSSLRQRCRAWCRCPRGDSSDESDHRERVSARRRMRRRS